MGQSLSLLQVVLEDLFGSVRFDTAWETPTQSLGPPRAFPIYRLLLGVKRLAGAEKWTPIGSIPASVAGKGLPRCSVLWDSVVGHVFGLLVESWRRQGRGTVIPATLVGAGPEGHPRTLSGHLTHFTWADDFVLVSEQRRRAWEMK